MRIFRSVRFNIFLGCLIALGSAVGTFLPQIPDAPEKVSAYQAAHPGLYRFLESFNLFNLYQSWWFMAMLALMAFDVVACKLWRRPPDHGIVALPPEFTREEELEKHLAQKGAALKLKPYRADLTAGAPAAEALARAERFLAAEGYHLHHKASGEAGASFIATRHRWQRWGSYAAHVALVVILLGALIKGLWGYSEMVPVLEGRSRAMQHKPSWEVFVDKFTIKYYEGGYEPKSYSSVLRVREGERVLGEKTINVNDPLDIGGVRFYQASWGAGGMFRSVTLKLGKREVQLPQRTPERLPGMPFTVQADMLLPDFTVTDGRADSGGVELQNPAVRFLFSIGAHTARPIWLFKNDPALCLVEGEDGVLMKAPTPPFHISDLDPVLFSGIQVAYDPGYKVVLAGSILWLFGMIGVFYLHRRRLWVIVEPDGARSKVSVGGWSSRGPEEFAREFDQLMHRLRSHLSGEQLVLSRNPIAEVAP